MDRLNQLRGEAGGSRDSTLDTTSPPSEGFMTANESSSKYYSLSEVDSTFDISTIKDDISSIKDVPLPNTTTESEGTMTNADELISNLSPIGKKSDILDSYKIDTQIEAANILSGGVAIFDDNDNSYDGHELVIDDNVDVDEKSNSESKQVNSLQFKSDDNVLDSSLISEEADIASKDTEVVLQIDGKNVDAIDIGNGLYLYRKEGHEELAAVQIIDDDQQQPSFKFLKVRENAEGNLEVYEEIEIEVPKEVPIKEGKTLDKKTPSHVPIKDINKIISDTSCNKVTERIKLPIKEPTTIPIEDNTDNKEISPDSKSELNLNGKMMKFSESRKSPVVGSFTPMTYHSTPKKEGIPLTKTMVDQQLHPNRHYDQTNIKKTIEVHTDSCKQKPIETAKEKDNDDNKLNEISSTEKEDFNIDQSEKDFIIVEETNPKISNLDTIETSNTLAARDNNQLNITSDKIVDNKIIAIDSPEENKNLPSEQENVIDSTEIVKEIGNETVQIHNVNIEKNDIELTNACASKVVEDVNIKDKLLIDTVLVDKNQVDDVIEVDSDPDDGKLELIKVDKAMAVDTAPCFETQKETINKDHEQVDINKEKENQGNMVIEEPILIEDDDVSIVEEVIVENKKDKEIHKRNIDDKNIDNVKAPEYTSIVEKDVVIIDKEKSIDSGVEILEKGDSTHSNVVDQPELKIDSSSDKNTLTTTSESHAPKLTDVVKPSENITACKPVENKINENTEKQALQEESNESLSKISTHSEITVLPKVSENKESGGISSNTSSAKTENKTQTVPKALEDKEKQKISSKVSEEKLVPSTEVPKVTEVKGKQIVPPSGNEGSQDQTIQSSKNLKDKHNLTSPSKVAVNKQNFVPLLSKPADNKQIIKSTESINTKDSTSKEDISQVVSAKVLTLPEEKQVLRIPTAVPSKPKKPEELNKKLNIGNTVPKPIVVGLPPKKDTFVATPVAQKSADSKNVTAIAVASIPTKPASSVEISKNVAVPTKPASSAEISKNVSLSHTKTTLKPLGLEVKKSNTSHRDQVKETKDYTNERGKSLKTMESNVPKPEVTKPVAILQDVSSSSSKLVVQSVKNKNEPNIKEVPKPEVKAINNNHAAVPFGKWTEANRQEFLNKFKTKTMVTSTNSNQLKNSNDLNRRDVLKKIDSQRQSSNALIKTQEANKLNVKPETAAFSNKPNIISKAVVQETKVPETSEAEIKSKAATSKDNIKKDVIAKNQEESLDTASKVDTPGGLCQRTEFVQNLIDKTIEGMIHRHTPTPKTQDGPKQNVTKESSVKEPQKASKPAQTHPTIEQATLDAIEMKMNELHGIPFIERPPHELPQIHKSDLKTYSKAEKEKAVVPPKTKIPNLLPYSNKPQLKVTKESMIEVDSEDEIIEHEPITGDIVPNKKAQAVKSPLYGKSPSSSNSQEQRDKTVDPSKKEAIITEKDFDKFARRNSITYENCLTVNFDAKEPHNVIKTVIEKDSNPKTYSKSDSKAKQSLKTQNVRPNIQASNKFAPAPDDASNRNQSKLQKAYHSALTAKRQMAAECPITIIEDKPVKVVFMDSIDYVPTQLNVQGQDLSPSKRILPESEITVSTCDSLDSDMLDSIEEVKFQEDSKTKTKHQRKQVLTPVDEPELELIEPKDLGLEVSPKKKRKTDDDKADKNVKYPMRKKFYLLSSSGVLEEKVTNPVEVMKNPLKETVNLSDNTIVHKSTVSALDNLVKAAELIETQTENINSSIISNPDSQSSTPTTTPVKRGRGRPRKYPLTPDGAVDKSKVITPSPQKKPRLIDAKPTKRYSFSDDSDTDDEIIKENWTMGKINENIVCPICNKLFRSENVVFKHVKHCTGPSPSRSDSDKRSPRRSRVSQDYDTSSQDSKSDDMNIDDDVPVIAMKQTPKKRKSKDSVNKSPDKVDIIVIEDTPLKEKTQKSDERKKEQNEPKKAKTKIPLKSNNLVCEFCGKTFRQLSYLVSHRLQHKKDKVEPKKVEKEAPTIINSSVYSCEVCKKEFRKLHHLVQHRIIHNPTTTKPSRKSSAEQVESKVEKEPSTSKQSEDTSAGFRCEPCDKSFRKLHHLVEHRETHDGINRQKTTVTASTKDEKIVEKPTTIHQCDVCKKTFKKLQQLNEHKESHVETSSDKSDDKDDKSVKSCLSTRDIIHECSLCYMVFPNEHSLNKHTIICLRKKRQSKQVKPKDETEGSDEVIESPLPEDKIEIIDSPISVCEDATSKAEEKQLTANELLDKNKPDEVVEIKRVPKEPVKTVDLEKDTETIKTVLVEKQVPSTKRDFLETETAKTEAITQVPEKIQKVEQKVPVKMQDTPKKKTVKEKTPNKRLKVAAAPKRVSEDVKPVVETSDDDEEVRYMLNPNFKAEDVTEEKVFMKVRAKKRSSLQIERPNSKDLMKRRTSLQHPPKIPRLKSKGSENVVPVKKEIKAPKLEPVPSDSDDSETTKYSFPSTVPVKPTKPPQDRTPKDTKTTDKKLHKKLLAEKRKSLSGIAKRKTLGKPITPRSKVSPIKQIKKRALEVEHRCDCGQLFSSAALLSRHTTLAHTPPRIRRRRSPPPEDKPVIIKQVSRKSTTAEKPKQTIASRKSSARSDSSTSTNTKPTKTEVKGRKSFTKEGESLTDKKAKLDKSETKSSVKPRRTGPHRGVPVPEKMRKLMLKNK